MNDKDLYWQNDKTPASRRFEDIYFSAEDGLQESQHVFLRGINAPEIWQDKGHFTLLENGFGTGLNFILTCQSWLNSSLPDSRLTYIATEKYPLSQQEMEKALSRWPDLRPLIRELGEIYPPDVKGFHQREMAHGRIKLLLLLGDSVENLSRLEAQVDAIYLDGFAPSRNPDMWTPQIFTEIARLAKPSAPLATFTAAGFVRRGLEHVGFHMQKSKGFGRKREHLTGIFNGTPPAYPHPWLQPSQPLPQGRHIAIIGGGIAGLTTGLALIKQGYHVDIYERDDLPMNRASGNPYAILDPYLTSAPSAEGEFYRTALLHALHTYAALDPDIMVATGLTKYPTHKQQQEKFNQLFAQNQWPAEMMTQSEDGALVFPEFGALSPSRIGKILSEKLSITCSAPISRLEKRGQWVLYSDHDKSPFYADAVVLCGGATAAFSQTAQLPLEPVRGQISLLSLDHDQSPPHNILCGKGYLIPPMDIDGKMTMICGATFHRNDPDTHVRDEDHQENIQTAATLWPTIRDHSTITGGRAALRAYSPDHLPLCGPVPDFTAYEKAYASLKHGPRHQIFDPAPYQDNLFILSGLGARGFLTAPLLADLLAAQISGTALPLPRHIYESLHPGRFLIRKLIKGK